MNKKEMVENGLDEKYSYVGAPSDGMYVVQLKHGLGLYGYINEKFELVIPCIYDDAGNFYNGRAIVTTEEGRVITIDKEGNELEDDYLSELYGYENK